MKKTIKLVALLLVLLLLFASCNLQPGNIPNLPDDTDISGPTEPSTPTDPDITTPQNPDDGKDPPAEIPPADDQPTDPPVDPQDPVVDDPVIDNPVIEDPVEEELPTEEVVDGFTYKVIHIFLSEVNVEKDGIYNTMEEVAVYIFLFNKLPSNYNTSSKYVKQNYNKENKLSYTGGTFYNREGLLPNAKGRTFTELDIGYTGGSRNALRIVYSSDGLIFYTSDHYSSFSLLRIHDDVN